MGLSRQEYWSGVPLPSPVNWLYLNKNKELKKRITQRQHLFIKHWPAGIDLRVTPPCNSHWAPRGLVTVVGLQLEKRDLEAGRTVDEEEKIPVEPSSTP